ncbi:hypothetical protein CPB84DRAFT_1783672 [Gymnopilus junonius]|uniref:HMG box domain-containing protein n=1 Tax=Gymnopilus junonius TaxID=109634 RepID=A0A9P5NKA3_GYMJU|nr:hypothetical protein CPB84DRAFT_1783672 [Gymnopilus junonius]
MQALIQQLVSKLKKDGEPPRPLNCFMLYRHVTVDRNPERFAGQQASRNSEIIGKMWKELDEAEKQVWEDYSKQAKELHEQLYPYYVYQPKKKKPKAKKSEAVPRKLKPSSSPSAKATVLKSPTSRALPKPPRSRPLAKSSRPPVIRKSLSKTPLSTPSGSFDSLPGLSDGSSVTDYNSPASHPSSFSQTLVPIFVPPEVAERYRRYKTLQVPGAPMPQNNNYYPPIHTLPGPSQQHDYYNSPVSPLVIPPDLGNIDPTLTGHNASSIQAAYTDARSAMLGNHNVKQGQEFNDVLYTNILDSYGSDPSGASSQASFSLEDYLNTDCIVPSELMNGTGQSW